jgi:hypothetical protein
MAKISKEIPKQEAPDDIFEACKDQSKIAGSEGEANFLPPADVMKLVAAR